MISTTIVGEDNSTHIKVKDMMAILNQGFTCGMWDLKNSPSFKLKSKEPNPVMTQCSGPLMK